MIFILKAENCHWPKLSYRNLIILSYYHIEILAKASKAENKYSFILSDINLKNSLPGTLSIRTWKILNLPEMTIYSEIQPEPLEIGNDVSLKKSNAILDAISFSKLHCVTTRTISINKNTCRSHDEQLLRIHTHIMFFIIN